MASLESELGKTGGDDNWGLPGHPPLCVLPGQDNFPHKPLRDWQPTLSEYMPKLVQLAFGCGRTRFATVAIEATVEPDPGLHQWVHDRQWNKVRPYYIKVAEQVANTLKLLKDLPTADGKNLLYHTLFLWAGELGDPSSHSLTDLNWVIGGQAGGELQTGRFVDAAGRSNADLFVSLGKLMDSGMTTFGDPAAFGGPISEIAA